jgi:hypothetical protein
VSLFRRLAFVPLLSVLFEASWAQADPAPVQVTAERIELDAESQELVLRGEVELDSAPFHLTSKELRLSRSKRGIVVRGEGRIAFCPCLAQPLAVAFRGATIAPPGDLLIDQPTLEVFHVPVLWLPFFWLRSPGKIGLLAPDIAYRGQDGVFLGEGVHLPWKAGDTQNGLDLRAGAYLKGGVATEATLKTPASVTTLRWDHLANGTGNLVGVDAADGVAVDARGGMTGKSAGTSLAWDVDLLRGQRGVVSTTDIDTASRVFDRAAAETSLHGGGLTFWSGVRATNPRGDGIAELGAAGPVAGLRRDGTLGDLGAYDAQVEGGTLSGTSLATTSFGRAALGGLLAAHAGPFRATWSLRGAGDVVAVGPDQGYEGAAQSRVELALPIARSFDSSDPTDPLWHRLEPHVEARALAAGGQADSLDSPWVGLVPAPLPSLALNGASSSTVQAFPTSVSGLAWIADGGLSSTLGHWGKRDGLELRALAGAAGSNDQNMAAVLRWKAAASFAWLGLGAEGAHVFGAETAATAARPEILSPSVAHAIAAHLRLGPVTSWHLGVQVAGREGVDPVLARALTDAPLPATMGFLAADGWTGGARLSVPLTDYLTARAGADGDLSAERLLAARGSVEFHDRCGCVVLTANGAERIGRPGLDLWLTVSLVRR